ncbi:hypothetical protein SELMODRAFT_442782 [Selaginella moellendorffii]|uniref:DDE Tnp4 domain-containing protein n=1 Tax=Selaginella moellendorffii TaxID=88036 RepID=D8RW16_SELML|nr:hypothetical protein SELMODRAFT_442782 [Selaginella moellendorffii]
MAIKLGREIHQLAKHKGLLKNNPVLGSSLVSFYGKCGDVDSAQEAFDECRARDNTGLWNSLIQAYTLQGRSIEALERFYSMTQEEGCKADDNRPASLHTKAYYLNLGAPFWGTCWQGHEEEVPDLEQDPDAHMEELDHEAVQFVDTSGFAAPAAAKRTRGKNWNHAETMVLIDLVREKHLAKTVNLSITMWGGGRGNFRWRRGPSSPFVACWRVRSGSGWWSVVPVDVRLGVTLYKLFKNTNYLDLVDKFGIRESTAHEIEPDCLLLLGRSTTRLDSESYYDRKQRYSVILQGDQAIPSGGQRVPTPAASDDSTHNSELDTIQGSFQPSQIVIEQAFGLLKMKFRCLDQKQKIQPKYLPNIIKSCCILHNFLIDVGETDLRAEIQAWRKEVKMLKDQDLFVDYGDPEEVEGEPREELHSPEDAKEWRSCLL